MTSPEKDRQGDRIAKLLARAGIASRREVERMIADGRVKIGEEVVTTPNTVLTSLKGVSVDGKPVKAADATRLFVFHKPSGLITAERDPAGRPTIYTALRNALPENVGRVMPIGRLDFNTEGLLLLTNDGELKRAMELPSTGLPRTYRARTFGDISQAQLEELIEGVEIDGIRYGKIDANMERRTGRNQWIEVTITEGKNREVRRVLEYLGLEVSRLLRTRYGPFELLDLPRGQAVEVRQADVERFRKALTGGTAQSVELSAPQQARARIARSAPRRDEAARAAPARPNSAKAAPARADGRKPDGRKPEGRKPEGRKPEGRKPEGRKPDGLRAAPGKSAPRKSGPNGGARKPGPRGGAPKR
ncbi:pseudouridine synthase [Novosphingobium sp.]|uniref:pseudouridine synthase n=1 Tax=Novosphingobium sp. TaxID=1874826 RepID=UPI0035B0B73F